MNRRVLLLVFGFLLFVFAVFWGVLSLVNWDEPTATSPRAILTDLTRVEDPIACENAPFITPAAGSIGLLYNDPRGPYSVSNPHQGIDIFTDEGAGVNPVYAAYDGYITRESHWVSSLIQRVPDDPLSPGREIWLYYTHMADREGNDFIEDVFRPGTSELFVEQGTLLGYMGDYNGNASRTIWVHLHFSIVLGDGNGSYLNELDINNTLDPSPYLGRSTNYTCSPSASECTLETNC